MIRKIWIPIFALFALSTSAFALELGVEPYAGYSLLGNTSIGSTSQYSFNGITVGARAFAKFAEMFFGGIDFSYYPSINATPTGQTTALSPAPTGLKAGIVAGVNLPMSFRAWLGYNPLDYLNFGAISPAPAYTANGYSFKIGVGYEVLSYLSINAEYFLASYGSMTPSGGTSTTLANAVSANHLLLSVSAPFMFSL